MRTFDFDQYSPSWWATRRGLPTASRFGDIITAAKGDYSKTARKYVSELVAEIILPPDDDSGFESAAMARGTELEPDARRFYAFDQDADPQQVGFCIEDGGRYGASPDALVGDDGALEIKCPLPKTHFGYLVQGGLPDDYKAQVHGCLLVTGRAWCDFVSYCPKAPLHVVRVERDEYTDKLAKALERFCDDLEKAKARVLAMAEAQCLEVA